MALQSGVDLVAIASLGCYTETYGAAQPANRANLYASLGFIEDAISDDIQIAAIFDYYFRRRKNE